VSANHEPATAAISTSACSWGGTWNSTWSTATASFKSPLVVNERGSALSGTYEIDPANAGAVEGKVMGSDFSGTWKRTRGSSGGPCQNGELTATIAPDCKSISGTWYWCTGPSRILGGTLAGTR
jgi:hypothetical protein